MNWSKSLPSVGQPGCYILDPPSGLTSHSKLWNDEAWELDDIVQIAVNLMVKFGGRFTVVVYTPFSMYVMKAALEANPTTNSMLVSEFIFVKVRVNIHLT